MPGLIPWGIWAASKATAPAGGTDYQLIATVFGDGSTSTVTFSSIPQTFKHLQIRATTRFNTGGGTSDASAYMRLNGDSTSSYSYHGLVGIGSNPVQSASAITASRMAWLGAGSGATTGAYEANIVDILDYTNTSKNKTSRGSHGITTAAGSFVYLYSGAWYSTSAVTSITLEAPGSAWTTASRFSLYGLVG